MGKIECKKRGGGLRDFNAAPYTRIKYCPCCGAVLYSNYEADRFAVRHAEWVHKAFDAAYDELGYHAAKLFVESTDKFLVLAFILAASHFLYEQLGVDRGEGVLTKKRIKEIVRLIKDTAYDGGF
jgi:hypothetical protein